METKRKDAKLFGICIQRLVSFTALFVAGSGIIVYIFLYVLTTKSPMKIGTTVVGTLCMATRKLEANYDVYIFLPCHLIFVVLVVLQSFDYLFWYLELIRAPSCGNSAAHFSNFDIQAQCNDTHLNAGIILILFLIFACDLIAVTSYPIFAFLAIKLIIERKEQERIAMANQKFRDRPVQMPGFLESLPALLV